MVPQRRSLRHPVWPAMGVALTLVVGGCGGEELDRNAFLALTTRGDNGLSNEVADCLFDEIRDNEKIMTELREKGPRSSDLSDSTTKELETATARCILDAATTTTSAPERDRDAEEDPER